MAKIELTELEEQVRIVAKVRCNNEALKRLKAKALAEWEGHNQALLFNLDKTTEFLNEAEAKLRDLTLKAYAETGNKQPALGVGIREISKLEYDPKVALLWAQDHRLALKLDIPAFDKIAKASPLEFVEIRGEAQATIATDLSKYIEEVK